MGDTPGGAGPGALVLLRHGQSRANAEGRFTGWRDADLTEHGEAQARAAARLIGAAGLAPRAVHTSVLHRTRRTAAIICAELGLTGVPVRSTWRLNERNYGAWTGRVKSEVRAEVGAERFRRVRRSLDVPAPPLPPDDPRHPRHDPRYRLLPPDALADAESLLDVVRRVEPYWVDVLAGELLLGRTVLVVAHGNSLRALATVLDRLEPAEVERLNIPTAAPLVYRFDPALHPLVRGGSYLDPESAERAAAVVAGEGA